MAVLDTPQLDTLRADLWFGGLPADLSQALVAQGVLRRVRHAQHLFFRGDAPDGLYAVLSGTLRVFGVTACGKEALLSVMAPPLWFGEIALFDKLPRTHDVQADGDALVLHVPDAALPAMLAAHPGWWHHFGVLVSLKTRLLMIMLESQALLSPEGQLARRLLWMVRTSALGQGEEAVRLKVRQGTLGEMLSMARQTVNRILKDLEARGVVKLAYGTVEVSDIHLLADVALLTPMERRVLKHLGERTEAVQRQRDFP